jgi:phosphoglycerol transferase MdoB-like AlkP superfamily enzyme
MKKSHFNWILPIARFLLATLIFLSVSRLFLIGWQFDRVADTGGIWFILFQGIRFDLSLLAVLLLVPFVLLPILSIYQRSQSIALWVLKPYLLVLTAVLVFMELATPNFILQFDFRPNILFVEYLKYPKEIITMLLKAYPLQLLFALSVSALALVGMNRLLEQTTKETKPSIIWSAPFLSFLVFILCLLAGRSTLDHRPVNPSTVAFSNDSLVNSLALSSSYSVAYALYEKMRYENSDEHPYGNMTLTTTLDEIYQGMGMTKNDFSNSEISTLHVQKSKLMDGLNKPQNLVIILEESLGANYVGKLGGYNITSNLDALRRTGYLV